MKLLQELFHLHEDEKLYRVWLDWDGDVIEAQVNDYIEKCFDMDLTQLHDDGDEEVSNELRKLAPKTDRPKTEIVKTQREWFVEVTGTYEQVKRFVLAWYEHDEEMAEDTIEEIEEIS